jgi:hypothetical protein
MMTLGRLRKLKEAWDRWPNKNNGSFSDETFEALINEHLKLLEAIEPFQRGEEK